VSGGRTYRVPYGHSDLEFTLQPWFDIDVLSSAAATPVADLGAAAIDALRTPLGSPRLRDLAAAARSATDGRPAQAVIAVTIPCPCFRHRRSWHESR